MCIYFFQVTSFTLKLKELGEKLTAVGAQLEEKKNIYIITQIILAFWLVLAYDLLENRCTIDVTISEFFPLCFKMAESFEN